MTTVIMRTTARVVLPLVTLYSFTLFLQGHNLPGGGFIAGVLTAIGIALVYLAYDIEYLEGRVLREGIESTVEHINHHIVVRYRNLFAVGLGIAIASGFVYVVQSGFELEFLTQDYSKPTVPIYGHIELASAVVFDFGVYCVVVGALLTIVSVVGEE